MFSLSSRFADRNCFDEDQKINYYGTKHCYFVAQPCVIFTTQQLLATKKHYLTIIAATLSTNVCAIGIVGTLIACSNVYKSLLNNISSSFPLIFLLLETATVFLAPAKLMVVLNITFFTSLPLANIF